MSRVQEYRQILLNTPLQDWELYLIAESRLPGPRSNLELAQAVARIGEPGFLKKCLQISPKEAP